ncbi:MAG: tetratricopeptide repeat protein, partial [Candidatus Omnitrophica bacterium]|nr:tetratricopeptide repeat protein [Candidatus Omnitrophota bacterium]
MKKEIIAVVFLLTVSFPHLIFAEKIVLNSGTTVEGKIIEKNEEGVTVDVEGTASTYPYKEIAKIDDSSIGMFNISTPEAQEAQKNLDLGISQFEKGEYRQAIVNYTKAIDIVPDLPQAYFDRGLAYFRDGNLDEAIADYSKAIEINPNYSEAFANRGSAYYFKNDLNKALVDFNSAIKIEPKNALLYGQHSGVLIEMGKYEEAIADLNKALELDPNLGEAYVNLAVVKDRKS